MTEERRRYARRWSDRERSRRRVVPLTADESRHRRNAWALRCAMFGTGVPCYTCGKDGLHSIHDPRDMRNWSGPFCRFAHEPNRVYRQSRRRTPKE